MTLWRSIRRAAEKAAERLHLFGDAGAVGTGAVTGIQNEVGSRDRFTHTTTVTLGTTSSSGDVDVNILADAAVLFAVSVLEGQTEVTDLTRAVIPAGAVLGATVSDAGTGAEDIEVEITTRPVIQ